MKIALTLTRAQAEVLVRATFIGQPLFNTREQRVLYSIMREVSLKANRFYMGFTTQKQRRFWLKLYEADMLEKFLGYILTMEHYGQYERQTLLQITYDINEQLA
jgi:hypothetical protein